MAANPAVLFERDLDQQNARSQRAYWTGHIALGFAILAGVSLTSFIYFQATDEAAHRGLLAGIAAVMAALAVLGIAVARFVGRQHWRSHFVLIASLVASLVLDLCAVLDGGLDSPVLYMSVLPLIFAGMLLSPKAVAGVGAVSVAGVVFVGITDSSISTPQENRTMFTIFVVAVVILTVLAARHRVRMQLADEQLMRNVAERYVTDGLTGCWNQHAFHELLPREVERAIRYGRPLSLIVCDVDFFKDYNDRFGHEVGDAELAQIGTDLRLVTRASDVVARIGGDEFAVLMPETAIEVGVAVAQRILADRQSRGNDAPSLSIGVTALRPDEPTSRRLFRDADQAMYDAKLAGRDRVSARDGVVPGELSERSPRVAGTNRRLLAAVRRSDLQRVEAETVLDAYLEASPVGFALVDRDMRVVRMNPTLASLSAHPSEPSGLGQRISDLIPALWSELAPHFDRALRDGLPTLNAEVTGRSAAGGSSTWLITVFPILVGNRVSTVGLVIVDITKRKRWEQTEVELTDSVVGVLAAAVEARDPYTAGHQKTVSRLAIALAQEMKLSPGDVRAIGLAAAIHDIGKMAVPAELLSRPGPLSELEMVIVRGHADAGYGIVKDVEFPWPIAEMIRQHHERMDGSGYPDGLRGDAICLGARIIAVADIVEAMTAHRPYRSALGIDAAVQEIRREAGVTLDAAVVNAFERLLAGGVLPLKSAAVA